MARDDPQMKLRLPEDLRDQIVEAADINHRSLNAEIIARLQDSFAARAHGWTESGEDIFGNPERTVYVLLDTNGQPISWDEINEHIGALSRKGRFASLATYLVTPQLVSSADRQREARALARHYAKLRREERLREVKAKEPPP